MTDVESAWGRLPGYRIDLLPWRGLGRVRLGEQVLGESDACLIVLESDHEAQLYLPEACIAWEHFAATDHHTVCPFKGEADYWTLTASDPPRENVAWTYRTPFEEVGGLAGHVAFYDDRLVVELVETFPSQPGHEVVHRMPRWGDAVDLLGLMDVAQVAEGRFRGLAQGEGRVFSRDGRLVASYTVQAMIRGFETPPGELGKDYTDAM